MTQTQHKAPRPGAGLITLSTFYSGGTWPWAEQGIFVGEDLVSAVCSGKTFSVESTRQVLGLDLLSVMQPGT